MYTKFVEFEFSSDRYHTLDRKRAPKRQTPTLAILNGASLSPISVSNYKKIGYNILLKANFSC